MSAKIKKTNVSAIQLVLVISPSGQYCYWCGRPLRECGMCQGSGELDGEACPPCKGLGFYCSTHADNWQQKSGTG